MRIRDHRATPVRGPGTLTDAVLMRAVVCDRYGPPDVLRLEDVARPVPKDDALFLEGLIEAGKYRAVIDRCYPLEQVVEATTYVASGQKTGNVVLTVGGRSG